MDFSIRRNLVIFYDLFYKFLLNKSDESTLFICDIDEENYNEDIQILKENLNQLLNKIPKINSEKILPIKVGIIDSNIKFPIDGFFY